MRLRVILLAFAVFFAGMHPFVQGNYFTDFLNQSSKFNEMISRFVRQNRQIVEWVGGAALGIATAVLAIKIAGRMGPPDITAGTSFTPVTASNVVKREAYAGVFPKEISDLISQINDPNNKRIDATGFVLSGQPGSGKTFLARIIAGEVLDRSPVFLVDLPDLKLSYIGASEKVVKKLFATARAAAAKSKSKKAIIFIDEIHTVKPNRINPDAFYETFLTEIDGINKDKNSDVQVIVIGATNRYDELDSAFTRPGRLSTKVNIKSPDQLLREKLLKIYLNKFFSVSTQLIDPRLDLGAVAQYIALISPAGIQEICGNVFSKVSSGQSIFGAMCFEILRYKKIVTDEQLLSQNDAESWIDQYKTAALLGSNEKQQLVSKIVQLYKEDRDSLNKLIEQYKYRNLNDPGFIGIIDKMIEIHKALLLKNIHFTISMCKDIYPIEREVKTAITPDTFRDFGQNLETINDILNCFGYAFLYSTNKGHERIRQEDLVEAIVRLQ